MVHEKYRDSDETRHSFCYLMNELCPSTNVFIHNKQINTQLDIQKLNNYY